MIDTPIVEIIDPDLEELMERFFDNSRKDIKSMRTALECKDFETLTRLGHTAKGTGYGYGFKGMGKIGLALEEAAKMKDCVTSHMHIDRMEQYLSTVKVKFGK